MSKLELHIHDVELYVLIYTHCGKSTSIVLTHHGITQVIVRRLLNPITLTFSVIKYTVINYSHDNVRLISWVILWLPPPHPFISASFLRPVSMGSDIPTLWLSFVLALFWIQVFSMNLAYLRSSVILRSYINVFLSYELREILSKVTSRYEKFSFFIFYNVERWDLY